MPFQVCIRGILKLLPVALGLLISEPVTLSAQSEVFFVDPGQTDPAIETVHSPHLAVYDPQAASRPRLFLFIPGTGAKATNSLAMDKVFAKWGYHAISIDYENNVIATTFVHDLDDTAFGRYRSAIITGGQASDKLKVNADNSILNRVQKLLSYLVKHDPQGEWDQFLENGMPAWDRIIVAGHSQGSGHAGYIGKMFKVDRVLMFSGPQDYMDDLHKPAAWENDKSATPPDRFFAFLSKNDPFNSDHQEANCMTLMHLSGLETTAVKPGEAIQGNCQILVNDVPQKRAHGSTISTEYTNAWEYMVTQK
jgi:hypothetical protein